MPAMNDGKGNSGMNLSEAILSEIQSWPDLHRNLFVQSHYYGKSTEQLSLMSGIRSPEIRIVLEQCGRKLRAAVRSHRGHGLEPGCSPYAA
jgi:hypothetical protein